MIKQLSASCRCAYVDGWMDNHYGLCVCAVAQNSAIGSSAWLGAFTISLFTSANWQACKV